MQDTDIFMQVIHDLERNRLKSVILSCAVPRWGCYYLPSPLCFILIQIWSKHSCLYQRQNDKHIQHYTSDKAEHGLFSAEPSVVLWTPLVLINEGQHPAPQLSDNKNQLVLVSLEVICT